MPNPSPEQDDAAPGDALAIWLLAVGQTLGFACLYYLFAALLVAWEAELGWSKAELAAGPTLSIVVSALLAPFAGRMIDRGYGGQLLWGGAVWGGIALGALALSEGPVQYLAAWAAIGVAHAGCLYEVCFAFLTRRLGAEARGAIVRVTLVAGFASTLAFPAGAALADIWGWRGAVAAFAATMLVLTAPMNAYAALRLRRLERRGPARVAARGGGFRTAARRPEFWLLALIYGALSLNHSTLVSYAIPLFAAVGAGSAMAITAASCVGPAQVGGRVVLVLMGTRVSIIRAVQACFILAALASACLIGAHAALWLIFAYALAQGAAAGTMSILKPLLTAQTLGREDYGAMAGAIAIAPLSASAIAPTFGAAVIDVAGETGLVATTLALALLALSATALLRRRTG